MAYTNNNGQIRVGVRRPQTITSSLLQSIYGVWNAETTTTTLATGAYGAWNGEGILSGTQLSASMSNAWQGNNSAFSSTNYSNITASMSNLWKAETSGSYLDSSLSNYWSLNNTANSGVGSINGTWVGTPDYVSAVDGTVTLPNAAHGTADRYISLPDNSLKLTGSFSVSGYYAVQTGGSHCIISSFGSSSTGYNNGWSVYLNGSLTFQIVNNGTVVNAVVSGVGGLGYIYQFTATYNPGVGISLYVKSKSQNINSSTFTATTMSIAYESTQRAALMTYRYGTSNADYKLYGYVSGINIFNKVLTSADVDALYNLGTYTTYPYSSLTLPSTKDSLGTIDGTIKSGAAYSTSTKRLGSYSLSFDGINGYVSLPSGSLNFTGDFSINVWVNPTNFNNTSSIISNWNISAPLNRANGWEIKVETNGKVTFIQANSANYNTSVESSCILSAGVWSLITLSRTSTTTKMWIDGVPSGSVPTTMSIGYTTPSFPTIGINQYLSGAFQQRFLGYMDEIGIWNRGLTDNEVIGLYENGNGQPYPYSNSTTLALDSFGTTNGVLQKGVTFSTGKVGNAFIFSGSNYVDLPLGSLNKTSDFSVSLWVYPTVNNTTISVISCHDGVRGWRIEYSSGNLWFWGDGSGSVQLSTGHTIVLNTWTHVLITFKNGVNAKSYINGVLTNTVSLVGKYIVYDNYSSYFLPILGGQRYFSPFSAKSAVRSFFTGKLDAIGLWDRELTSDEASAIYNGGSGNEYPFSNASVSSPADSVSTNHGTNVGGVTYTTGIVGNAFTFNGSNYISLPNNSLNSTVGNDFSVSLWVNFTSTSNQGLMSNLTNPSVNYYTGWDIRLTSGIPTFNMWDSYLATALQGNVITTNTWYHIVVTRKKGTRSRIYMNGSLVQSNTNTSDPTISSTYYPNIGHFQYLSTNGASTATYHGLYMANGSKIDAVNVWNKELTDDEITQLYNMGGGVQYPFTTQTIKAPYAVYNGDSLVDPIGTRNAAIVGGVTYTTGKIGNAYTFDGTTGYLTLPANSMRFAGSFSISMWIYPTVYPTIAQGTIGLISNPSLGYGDGYDISLYNNGSNTITLYSRFGTANGNATFPIQLQATAPTLNTWTLVTITFEGGIGAKTYYNGVLQASVNSSITTLLYTNMPTTYTPTIGYGSNATGPFVGAKFAGQIDGLTFWNSALTAPEVLTLFNDGNGMEYPYSSTLPAKLPSYGDVVGTNHGTSPATSTPTFTGGKVGKAYNFDGINDYVELPSNSLNSLTGNFSISMWVKWGRNNTSQILIANLNTNYGLGFFVEHAAGQLRFKGYKSAATNAFYAVKNSYTPTVGIWYHYTFTHKDQVNNIYENGVLIASDTTTTGHVNHGVTNWPTIGVNKYNSTSIQEPFQGAIDMVNIWSKELSEAEITNLYNSGNGKQYPNY